MPVRIIYEPKGRAREYAPLAVSMMRGCDHGCIYCFVPAATHTKVENFLDPYVRENAIDQLTKDLDLMYHAQDDREVLMSFTCDPYSHYEGILGNGNITRQALHLFKFYGRHCTILTKGGLRSQRDFDILSSRPHLFQYGATLVFIAENDRRIWEPNAAPTYERMQVLYHAHLLGIPTWVSLEPVIDPEQTLCLIKATASYVDHFKVGKLNHDAELEKSIDWPAFREDVIELLESLGKDYYIKKDLQEAK